MAGMIDGVDYIGEVLQTLEQPSFMYAPGDNALARIADIDLRTTSGGSGTGKGTILAELQQVTGDDAEQLYWRIVTWATRDMREGEVDGVGYYFLHKPHEHRRIQRDFINRNLLQIVQKYGNLYGSFPEDYEAARGKLGLVDCVPGQAIDFRTFGFRSVVNVLVVPPNYETWIRRWFARNVEPDDVFNERLLDTARMHKQALEDGRFIFVPNDSLEDAVKDTRDAFEGFAPNRARLSRARDMAAKIMIRIFDDFGLSDEVSLSQRINVMSQDELDLLYHLGRSPEGKCYMSVDDMPDTVTWGYFFVGNQIIMLYAGNTPEDINSVFGIGIDGELMGKAMAFVAKLNRNALTVRQPASTAQD